MVLFNADGSRAEMSGNGIRCFAQALAARRGDLAPQRILTDAGARRVDAVADRRPAHDRWRRSTWATVSRSRRARRLGATSAPIPTGPVAHLSVGNPHTVVGVDDVARRRPARARRRGAARQPRDHRGRARAATPSRCASTSAAPASPRPAAPAPCAAAWAAARWGLVDAGDGKLVVHMDGGSAKVALDRTTAADVSPDRPGHVRRHDRDRAPRSTISEQHPYSEALGATLIERAVRERIVLVGVTFPGVDRRRHRRQPRRAGARSIDTAGADEVGRHGAAPRPPGPHVVHRQGQGRGAARAVPRRRRRHRRVRQRADARPSSTTSRSCSAARRSTAPR